MRDARRIFCCVLLSLCLASFFGCGKSADEEKPLSEAKAEAEKMSTQELRATAVKYKDSIVAKSQELEKVMATLKDIPATEQLGEEASELKTEIEQLRNSVSALKQRFEVYYEKLKEKGGDVSGLEL
jgi:uncharacterized coiled-coil DUF342 family protein